MRIGSATTIAIVTLTACNPNQPRGYRGAPLDSSLQPNATSTSNPSQNDKVGVTKQVEKARRQAGEVGSQAESPITKDQLRFGSSAGQSKSHSPQPFADAEGEVLIKPSGPMSERQIRPTPTLSPTQKQR